jgi:hypothetical protein
MGLAAIIHAAAQGAGEELLTDSLSASERRTAPRRHASCHRQRPSLNQLKITTKRCARRLQRILKGEGFTDTLIC